MTYKVAELERWLTRNREIWGTEKCREKRFFFFYLCMYINYWDIFSFYKYVKLNKNQKIPEMCDDVIRYEYK